MISIWQVEFIICDFCICVFLCVEGSSSSSSSSSSPSSSSSSLEQELDMFAFMSVCQYFCWSFSFLLYARFLSFSSIDFNATGLLEYLIQSNNNADNISPADRYISVDYRIGIITVNLLTIDLTSINLKYQLPNDIPIHLQRKLKLNKVQSKFFQKWGSLDQLYDSYAGSSSKI